MGRDSGNTQLLLTIAAREPTQQRTLLVESPEGIDDVLEDLGCPLPKDHKLSLLNQLSDRVRRGDLEVGFLEGRIENLVGMIALESDLDVRAMMFDVAERAMSAHPSLAPSLDPLMCFVGDAAPDLLANSLMLIAKLGDPKHRALVERCLTHANEFVRRNAEYAWRHTYGPK